MQWYCPVCWAEWGEGAAHCLMCGAPRSEKAGFVQRLIEALEAEDAAVVQRAASILGEEKQRGAVPALLQILETRHEEFVLEAAATALGSIGERTAVGALCEVVSSGPRAAREAACVALAQLSAQEALPVLRAAILSLGRSGLAALGYLEGRAAQPPPPPSARWKRRPALGGDPGTLVRERIGISACPVCALVSEDVGAFLAQWQYLSGLHEPIRQRFCERGGFCRAHLSAVREISSPQGLAPTLGDLLLCLADLDSTVAGTPLGNEMTCQACELCAASEMRYLQALAALVEDDSFRSAYPGGRGLCIPHFVCLLAKVPDQNTRRWLAETQRMQLRRLADEMRSHLRKCRERRRRETTRDEEQAAWRTLGMVAGDSQVNPGISDRINGPQQAQRT